MPMKQVKHCSEMSWWMILMCESVFSQRSIQAALHERSVALSLARQDTSISLNSALPSLASGLLHVMTSSAIWGDVSRKWDVQCSCIRTVCCSLLARLQMVTSTVICQHNNCAGKYGNNRHLLLSAGSLDHEKGAAQKCSSVHRSLHTETQSLHCFRVYALWKPLRSLEVRWAAKTLPTIKGSDRDLQGHGLPAQETNNSQGPESC